MINFSNVSKIDYERKFCDSIEKADRYFLAAQDCYCKIDENSKTFHIAQESLIAILSQAAQSTQSALRFARLYSKQCTPEQKMELIERLDRFIQKTLKQSYINFLGFGYKVLQKPGIPFILEETIQAVKYQYTKLNHFPPKWPQEFNLA